jgi:hypothetical protein
MGCERHMHNEATGDVCTVPRAQINNTLRPAETAESLQSGGSTKTEV